MGIIRWVGGLRETLRRIASRGPDLTRPLRVFGAYMLQSVSTNFAVGGRRNGRARAWAPLSEVTIRMRPKAQRGRPRILVRTGQMRNGNVYEVSGRRRLVIGNVVPHAPKHQQGGRWGAAIRETTTTHVPSHKAMRWVRPETKGVGRKSGLLSTKQAMRLVRTTVDKTKKIRAYTPPVRRRPFGVHVSKKARGALARARGLVRRAIMVSAHVIRRTVTIPARPFLVFQPQDFVKWTKFLAAHYRAIVAGAGEARG